MSPVFAGESEFLKLCADVTVYWKGSVFDRVEGVVDFYQKALSLIRGDIKFYTTETMEGARRIRSDTFDLIPFWFLQSKRKRKLYILTLEGGEKADVLSDTGFYLCANEEAEGEVGALRLILPVRYLAESPQFADLVSSLIEKLDFQSGHGGYAVNWFPTSQTADEALSQFPFIARRYPGIDLSDIDITLYAIRNATEPGIKCINWLTLLGVELTERVGGVETLKAALPPDCPVLRLPKGGVLIQAGERPDIGDRNANAQLQSYHAVGRLLALLRLRNHPDLVGAMLQAPYEELTAEWLARFDDLNG